MEQANKEGKEIQKPTEKKVISQKETNMKTRIDTETYSIKEKKSGVKNRKRNKTKNKKIAWVLMERILNKFEHVEKKRRSRKSKFSI